MIEKFLEKHQPEANKLKDEYLDKLEELVYKAALGEAPSTFKMNDALKVLKEKRPREWGGKVVEEEEEFDIPAMLPDETFTTEVVKNKYGEFIQALPTREPKPTVIRVENIPKSVQSDYDEGRVGPVCEGGEI